MAYFKSDEVNGPDGKGIGNELETDEDHEVSAEEESKGESDGDLNSVEGGEGKNETCV